MGSQIYPNAAAKDKTRQLQKRQAVRPGRQACIGEQDDPVDLRQLEALGGPDFAAELLQAFYVEANDGLRTMREVGPQGEGSALARAAHALKGSSGAVGAGRVADICLQLEAIVHRQDLSPVPGLLDELEAEIERVRIFMERR